MSLLLFFFFFFFNDTATTEIYTLSLHDALPISLGGAGVDDVAGRKRHQRRSVTDDRRAVVHHDARVDRKSTRLNSSHLVISYAVFCLKKKNIRMITNDKRASHHASPLQHGT